ncbi:MAG: PilN domain-containing protein [Mycobacteriales bacterium]
MTTQNVDLAAVVGPTATEPYRLPRVNLLPPEIQERKALRRLQAGLGAAVVVVAGLTGFAYWQAQQSVTTAQNNLVAAQQQTATLQGRLASLSNVRSVYSAVDEAKALVVQALGGQIQWSRYLTDLSLTVPPNVWVTSFNAQENANVTPPAAGASVTPSAIPGVATTTGVGTVQISGVALHRNDVATWLETLAREKGYAAAYVSDITESVIGNTVVYKFDSTVVLTPAALWGQAATLLGS